MRLRTPTTGSGKKKSKIQAIEKTTKSTRASSNLKSDIFLTEAGQPFQILFPTLVIGTVIRMNSDFTNGFELPVLCGRRVRVCIVSARWNKEIVKALEQGVLESLHACGVLDEDIIRHIVPGSFELPIAAKRLSRNCDVVICLGALIKGETHHYEYICESVAYGLQKVALESNVPMVFGVLMCPHKQQALARAGLTKGGYNNGLEWGRTAVEMAYLKGNIKL